jgi:sulfur carrier protein ThiS
LKLIVNGEATERPGVRTVGDLLKALELRDGDRIEIIHAVGGG